MKDKKASPDIEKAKRLLEELWMIVLEEDQGDIDPEIDRLINSAYVSIR